MLRLEQIDRMSGKVVWVMGTSANTDPKLIAAFNGGIYGVGHVVAPGDTSFGVNNVLNASGNYVTNTDSTKTLSDFASCTTKSYCAYLQKVSDRCACTCPEQRTVPLDQSAPK